MFSTMLSTLVLMASVVTPSGRAAFRKIVLDAMSFIASGDPEALETIRAYKHKKSLVDLIDIMGKFVQLFAGLSDVAKTTVVCPSKIFDIKYKGMTHRVVITKASDAGLPPKLPGHAICRPEDGMSFVYMSDDLYENQFILMHEIGHSVQRVLFDSFYGAKGGSIMKKLSIFANLTGGFPLEPQADAFARKACGLSRLEYLREFAKMRTLTDEEMPITQRLAVDVTLGARALESLIMPVFDVTLIEVQPGGEDYTMKDNLTKSDYDEFKQRMMEMLERARTLKVDCLKD